MTTHDTKPAPPQPVAGLHEQAPHRNWRASYASAVLIGVLVLGFLVLTPNIYFEGTPWLALVFFGAYAAAGAAVAWRGSVALKVALSVAILGASGIAAILAGASPSNGTFFFVALVTVVTLLRSPRSGAIATGIVLVVLAAVASLSAVGLLGIRARDAALHAPAGWIGAALAVLLFGSALVLGISHLQRSVETRMSAETRSPAEEHGAASPVPAPTFGDRSMWLQKALETGRELVASRNSGDAPSRLARAVRDVFGYPDVAVVLRDEADNGLRLAAQAGDPPSPAGESSVDGERLAALAIRSGAAQISGSGARSGDSDRGEGTPHPPEAAIPLMREDRAIAALRVRAASDVGFADDEIDALKWVASHAAVVLTAPQGLGQPANEPGSPPPPQQRGATRPWRPDVVEGAMEIVFGDMDLPDSTPRISVPLSIRDQEIGTISLAADADWTAEEQSLVEAVATQAALALDNARLMEASQLSASREHTLAEITAKVWAAATLDGVLRTTIEELAQALGADRATIELRTEAGDGG